MTLQKEADRLRINMLRDEVHRMCALPMRSPEAVDFGYEFGEAKVSSIPKVSGGKTPVVFSQDNFKRMYVDEYTGEELPPPLIRAAIEDELMYFNDKYGSSHRRRRWRKFPTTYSCAADGFFATRETP